MRNLQSLRLLLADKDKEIEELKKELTEEKNAYNKMYNMYVEEKERIDKAIEYIGKTEFPSKGYIMFCYELNRILKGEDKE